MKRTVDALTGVIVPTVKTSTRPPGGRDTSAMQKNPMCGRKLSGVNARKFSICKIASAIAAPLSLPFPGRFLPDLDRLRQAVRSFFWKLFANCFRCICKMSCTRELSNIGLRADNQKGILLPSQPAPLEMPGDQERCSHACSKEALWQNFNVPLPSLRSLQSSVPRVRSAERRCCSPAACRHSWAPTCIRSSAPYATTSLKRWARTKSLRRENSDAVYKRICDKAFAISPRT